MSYSLLSGKPGGVPGQGGYKQGEQARLLGRPGHVSMGRLDGGRGSPENGAGTLGAEAGQPDSSPDASAAACLAQFDAPTCTVARSRS